MKNQHFFNEIHNSKASSMYSSPLPFFGFFVAKEKRIIAFPCFLHIPKHFEDNFCFLQK